jgi:hypothetical protein
VPIRPIDDGIWVVTSLLIGLTLAIRPAAHRCVGDGGAAAHRSPQATADPRPAGLSAPWRRARTIRWHTVAVSHDSDGDLIVRVDVVATVWFVLTALTSAWIFEGLALWVGAVTALTLFLVGVVAFLWAFYVGVQRSRAEEISVTQLFLLFGGVAPAGVRRTMLSLLAVQVVVGLGAALARPDSSDGSAGSSLAFGVLVPMFGLGLNGLWGAYHGQFGPRAVASAEVPPSDVPIGQNDDHG